MNTVIQFETKSHYGGPELIYVVSEHKEPLMNLTGSKTLTPRHVEALKKLGFEFSEGIKPQRILSAAEKLDKLASHLESLGMIKEAHDLDVVSNTIENAAPHKYEFMEKLKVIPRKSYITYEPIEFPSRIEITINPNRDIPIGSTTPNYYVVSVSEKGFHEDEELFKVPHFEGLSDEYGIMNDLDADTVERVYQVVKKIRSVEDLRDAQQW